MSKDKMTAWRPTEADKLLMTSIKRDFTILTNSDVIRLALVAFVMREFPAQEVRVGGEAKRKASKIIQDAIRKASAVLADSDPIDKV